jgi:hypothetical protein
MVSFRNINADIRSEVFKVLKATMYGGDRDFLSNTQVFW